MTDAEANDPGTSESTKPAFDYATAFNEARSEVSPDYQLEDVRDLDRAPIYRGADKGPAELLKAVEAALDSLPNARQDTDRLWDLTDCAPHELAAKLDALTRDANILLHGSKTDHPIDELDPAKSRQVGHHEGRTAAINATTDGETALYYASFDYLKFRHLLPNEDSTNFGIGLTNYGYEGGPERSFQLQADRISYPILQEHAGDPSIYSDGYLYILDRRDFRPSSITEGQQRSDHEWSGVYLVKPLATLRIGAHVGPAIITPDKLVQNSH